MFAIPGIVALLTFIYVRPQDLVGGVFANVPFLYLGCALAIFGLAIDLKLRIIKPIPVPALGWALLFAMWVALSTAVKAGQIFKPELITMAISFLLFVVIAHGVQSFKTLRLVVVTMIVFSLFLILMSVQQGFADYGCVRVIDQFTYEPDGRPCARDNLGGCSVGDVEPGAAYRCEHVGLFDTTSIAGRTRYIGVLQDPNELAICMGASLALMLAWASRKRTLGGWGFLVLAASLTFLALILTGSRGGQLVFLSVLGTYFVNRFGAKGIAVGIVLALPLILLGGRGGGAADKSTMERYEAWRAGMVMFRSDPLFGVGKGMFANLHYLTAHNSYVLVLAELGFIGLYLWSCIVFVSVKVLWVARRTFAAVEGAAAARVWSLGFIAAFAGILVGITFLSFSYHFVLWIYLGLAGAVYSAVRSHVPDFRVKLTLRDGFVVLGLDIAFIVAVELLLRFKGV